MTHWYRDGFVEWATITGASATSTLFLGARSATDAGLTEPGKVVSDVLEEEYAERDGVRDAR